MKKKIGILGSTGSIGTQTLEVIDEVLDIDVVALSTNQNITLLEQQVRRYKPKIVGIMNEKKAWEFKQRTSDLDINIAIGMDGLIEIAQFDLIDTLVTSVVGTIGLLPTIKAIEAGKDIALANKETLVSAGQIVTKLAKEKGINIYPVDSEHSAIFQCLQGNSSKEVQRIILTASGGPFRGKTLKELQEVTVNEALNHPNWNMGKKITIDSATLMNKGLEVIEAKWLFDLEPEKISVLVHPQSIIHSMVEYIDGAMIAQLGEPDMRVPIQYALTYPERRENSFPRLDLTSHNTLSFENPDLNTFKCLKLALIAIEKAGTTPAVVNAANEAAVELFIKGEIHFLDIPDLIQIAMDTHSYITHPTLEEILQIDAWVKEFIYKYVREGKVN